MSFHYKLINCIFILPYQVNINYLNTKHTFYHFLYCSKNSVPHIYRGGTVSVEAVNAIHTQLIASLLS